MKPKTFRLLFIALVVSSCDLLDHRYRLVVELPDAEGLTINTPVKLNGVEVGRIEAIALGPDNQILATVVFQEITKLPVDSELRISTELFGYTSIELIAGTKDEYFKSGDTAKVTFVDEQSANFSNEGSVSIKDLPNLPSKQDSILIELRRLNKNIERLLEQNK